MEIKVSEEITCKWQDHCFFLNILSHVVDTTNELWKTVADHGFCEQQSWQLQSVKVCASVPFLCLPSFNVFNGCFYAVSLDLVAVPIVLTLINFI